MEKYKIKDSGSQEAQIFFLTREVEKLTNHLKKAKKDYPAKRALLKKVAKRKRFLKYLKEKKPKTYEKIIKELKDLL